MMFKTETLSEFAFEALQQLFDKGPTWDGNLVSKSGRDELVRFGLAERYDGWQQLTSEGLRLVVDTLKPESRPTTIDGGR